MKKLMSIALALTLALTLICTGALAEETHRRAGGRNAPARRRREI